MDHSIQRTFLLFVVLYLCTPSAAFAQYDVEPTRSHRRILKVAAHDEGVVLHHSRATDNKITTQPSNRALPSLSEHRRAARDGEPTMANDSLAGPAVTVTSSLAVVLGLFALMIYLTRRFGNRSLGQAALPSEVLQSLGTASLDARTKVNLLRCGGRVIVVAQTATGVFPISEFTSPDEVRQLIASCQSSSKHSFAQTLQAFEQEPAPPGFVGDETATTNAVTDKRSRGRLFATA